MLKTSRSIRQSEANTTGKSDGRRHESWKTHGGCGVVLSVAFFDYAHELLCVWRSMESEWPVQTGTWIRLSESLTETLMCGRSCVRTLSPSSCGLCGWAELSRRCGVGGCRSASGWASCCRWAGRCAEHAPPPTDTRDTAGGTKRGKIQCMAR